MSSFCAAKATHIFSATNFSIFAYLDGNFNESLTNDVVRFEQLGSALLVFCFMAAVTFFLSSFVLYRFFCSCLGKVVLGHCGLSWVALCYYPVCITFQKQGKQKVLLSWHMVVFICVEVLRPSQPKWSYFERDQFT